MYASKYEHSETENLYYWNSKHSYVCMQRYKLTSLNLINFTSFYIDKIYFQNIESTTSVLLATDIYRK